MSKADITRANIVQKAARLFNQRGYAGASIADVMQVTGLKKGGIYNHFASKDELAIAAFDFVVQLAQQRHIEALRGVVGGRAKLKTMVASFADSFEEIAAWGGCPLMNTAIDSDDTHPILQAKTQRAMDAWRMVLRRICQQAIRQGELAPTVDPDGVATIIIATLEGGLMLSRLYGDRVHLDRVKIHLEAYINSLPASVDSS